MGATLKAKKTRGPAIAVPWGMIPPTLRVLYITSRQRTGGWLAEAFAADSASEILLDQVIGSAAGMSRLRDETFDAVLVSDVPGELDAMELIEGYRAGGAEEPIIVLGTQSEQEMSIVCYEVGADAYVCVNTTTTRNLIWVVVRAVQRHQMVRENRRLKQTEQARLQREHEEAERLLEQQRVLIAEPELSTICRLSRARPRAGATGGKKRPTKPARRPRRTPRRTCPPSSSPIIASCCEPTSSWVRAICRASWSGWPDCWSPPGSRRGRPCNCTSARWRSWSTGWARGARAT